MCFDVLPKSACVANHAPRARANAIAAAVFARRAPATVFVTTYATFNSEGGYGASNLYRLGAAKHI